MTNERDFRNLSNPENSNAFVEGAMDGNPIDLSMDDSMGDLQALADQIAADSPDGDIQASDISFLGTEDGDPIIQELQAELKETHKRIKVLEKQEAEHQDRHHRLLADFNNYRNRTAREIQMAVDQAERKLMLEFLPVVDNFERCLAINTSSLEDFRNGVALIHKQFLDGLRRLGVEEVPLQVGDPFDAQHAEALTTLQDPNLPDGAVASIFERGFTLRSQLLRAARVVVNHQP